MCFAGSIRFNPLGHPSRQVWDPTLQREEPEAQRCTVTYLSRLEVVEQESNPDLPGSKVQEPLHSSVTVRTDGGLTNKSRLAWVVSGMGARTRSHLQRKRCPLVSWFLLN